MRNTTKTVAAMIVALALTAATANPAGANPFDPEYSPTAEEIGLSDAERLEFDAWPDAVDTSYGYVWEPYGLLADFTEVENTLDAVDAYWKQERGYLCFLERKLQFENASGASLKLIITRCPNYIAAKKRVLDNLGSVSIITFDCHGQSHGLDLGDVSVLRRVTPVPESYSGHDSNNLLFIRGNLIVEAVLTESDPPSAGFTAAQLCLEIDADILQQHAACGGEYPVPTATVIIDDPNGDLTTLIPPARSKTTPMSVTTSHPEGAQVEMHMFVAEGRDPIIVDENGQTVPDPSGLVRWRVMLDFEATFFDDIRNPTTLTMSRGKSSGNWQAVAVVWGPNMIPVYATADFVIIR